MFIMQLNVFIVKADGASPTNYIHIHICVTYKLILTIANKAEVNSSYLIVLAVCHSLKIGPRPFLRS